MTVQRALEILRNEDLIYSVQGRGTFVRHDLDPDMIGLEVDGGGSPAFQEVLGRLTDIGDQITAINARLSDLEAYREQQESR